MLPNEMITRESQSIHYYNNYAPVFGSTLPFEVE